jgi:hypothetical protein
MTLLTLPATGFPLVKNFDDRAIYKHVSPLVNAIFPEKSASKPIAHLKKITTPKKSVDIAISNRNYG